MKEFVIFVLLLAIFAHGDAKKVCILFEQKVVSTTTTVDDPVSASTSESISSVQDDGEITLGTDSSVSDDIVITLGDVSETAEEITTVNTEAVSVASNVIESISTDICALEGITLFDDQNDLLRKMCTVKPSASSLYVVTVQNSVVKSDLSLATLCSEGARGLLSWISWQDFVDKVKPVLNADELPPLVVRNSSIGGPSESENQADPISEVLIEVLPIKYKLVNLKRSAWTNSTFINTVSLGDIVIENPEDAEKHIDGELTYSFPIQTNITFLSSYPINGLPVELSDESDRRKDFTVGSGSSYLYNSTFSVERLVPANKKETVSLTATLGLNEYDIEGKIISIFGKNSDGSTIEESHFISARVVSSETYNIKDTYNLNDHTTTTTTTEDNTHKYEELPIAIPHVNERLYPGFRKYFYVALFLVLATLSTALFNVVRTVRKERKAKRDGRRTYQKIIPKI
ncbi:uncharacterized protein LOC119072075 [Bradysia coprophila]|uniref:uncharacterized protein LOC119072075 n=1 Tax=Bradysia coprophila TaxID=38358 RepID=UPI00187DC9A2|nr:uncharacterized protein LOC119072075 [Bradysia coprophila]